jgi:hypothetical protein
MLETFPSWKMAVYLNVESVYTCNISVKSQIISCFFYRQLHHFIFKILDLIGEERTGYLYVHVWNPETLEPVREPISVVLGLWF